MKKHNRVKLDLERTAQTHVEGLVPGVEGGYIEAELKVPLDILFRESSPFRRPRVNYSALQALKELYSPTLMHELVYKDNPFLMLLPK